MGTVETVTIHKEGSNPIGINKCDLADWEEKGWSTASETPTSTEPDPDAGEDDEADAGISGDEG